MPGNTRHHLLFVILALVVFVAFQGCSGPAPTPATTVEPSPIPGEPVTVTVTGQNYSFDRPTITVPAGASVTLVFNNLDTGITHNVAIYDTASAARVIFRGEFYAGPGTRNYRFRAPTTPGTYFFRCDIHPTLMTGSFVVTP